MNDFFDRLCKALDEAKEAAGTGGSVRDGQIGIDPGQAYLAGVRDGLQRAAEIWGASVLLDGIKLQLPPRTNRTLSEDLPGNF